MKRVWLSMLVVVVIILATGCPDVVSSDTVSVTVYFMNESASIGITSFQWKLADDTWSADLIPEEEVLPAGDYFITEVVMPRNGKMYYRVKSDNSDYITHYEEEALHVLHWAGDTRYCGVTLAEDKDGIYASGFTSGWSTDEGFADENLASWQQ